MTLNENFITLTTRIIQASEDNLKIKFRLRSTPVGRYILFHPYSVFTDRQSGKEKVYGFVERHYYTDTINNELCCIFIDKLAELVVTKDSFHKPCEWRSRIDPDRYRITTIHPNQSHHEPLRVSDLSYSQINPHDTAHPF